MVTLNRWSVYSLSRCVHTLDHIELDSQHAPSSSSRVGFGRYPKSASIRVLESTSIRISRSPLRLVLCGVAESVLRLALCGVAEFFAALRSSAYSPPQACGEGLVSRLLFGRYLHREGIVMGHILVVGVTRDLGLRS